MRKNKSEFWGLVGGGMSLQLVSEANLKNFIPIFQPLITEYSSLLPRWMDSFLNSNADFLLPFHLHGKCQIITYHFYFTILTDPFLKSVARELI